MKYFFWIFVIFSPALFSQEAPSQESEFQLEKGLMERLYQESVTESYESTANFSAGINLSGALSLFNPNVLTLSNDYFEIPYADGMGSVPGISITASSRLFNWGGLHLFGLGGVGYSMKEAVQSARSKTGTSGTEHFARITLHWLPISLGARMEYQFRNFSFVRPFVLAKGGAEWLYQSGGLDGIAQGFWIPFLQYGGGLNLFDSSPSPDKWFGGVMLGVSKHQSFSSAQLIDGTVFDLGVNILL